MTETQLCRLFEEFNARFFHGRLPRYRVRESRTHRGGHFGTCNSPSKTILLQPQLSQPLLRRTLLHEMCHIGTPSHGSRFRAKLLRLATMGEAWATEEAQLYANKTPWLRELSQHTRDLAASCPDWSVTQALSALAREYSFSRAELLRKAPWVRTLWCREARQQRDDEQNRIRLLKSMEGLKEKER